MALRSPQRRLGDIAAQGFDKFAVQRAIGAKRLTIGINIGIQRRCAHSLIRSLFRSCA